MSLGAHCGTTAGFIPWRPVARFPMVTFDKGNRVVRLEEGAHLDGRQLGILLSGLRRDAAATGTGKTGRLSAWDAEHNPAIGARIEGMVRDKGDDAKPTLLLALSTDTLRRLVVEDHDTRERITIEGRRGPGYDVVSVEPLD